MIMMRLGILGMLSIAIWPSSVKAAAAVGGIYAPFVLAQAGTGNLEPINLLLQMPILGILVLVVWLFLQDNKRRELAQLERDMARDASELEAGQLRADTLEHIGADCHGVQREANGVMERMRSHMEADAEVRGKTIATLERLTDLVDRLERRLDQTAGD